jgi:23S rRNA (guanosine2251-2'-O)-methyltransferase
LGNKIRNDNKIGPKFHFGKKKPYGENGSQRFDEDKKPYGEKRGSKYDEDKKPYGDKRGSRFDEDKKPYGEKRGSKFDADKKPYGDKRDSKFSQDKKPYGDKRDSKFNTEKKSPYPGGPEFEYKPVVETQDEFVGEIDKLEGRNPIMEALKANRTINKIFVAKGEREGSIRQIIAMAREKKIIITEVEHGVLESMSSTKSHQGIIAFVAVKEYVEVDDILKIAEEKGQPPFIIILDEIADPHNFGAILRTANAVGAHGVIIPKRRAIGLTSAVSKASAGAIEYVPVARVTNIAQTIEYLKKNNVWVVGTDSTGEKAFYNSDLKGSIALVVGSEGEGMGKLIREKCDFVVNIPMQGEISSLNASVAAAIVMYEILKQRSKD